MTENSKHIIAQCQWDTSFDDQKRAFALQEFLSHWSRHDLPKELTVGLDRLCPADQTWRLDSLELDLGEIELDDLETELPLRFRKHLDEELKKIILNHEQGGGGRKLQIMERSVSMIDLLRSFLIHGSMPWWRQGDQAVKEILKAQLSADPAAVASLLRETGKKEAVRLRIVRQWEEDIIKKIITLLEPHHYEYIFSFSENLRDVQEKGNLPQKERLHLKRNRWLWILTHLLVERGTLFNTVMFVKHTLRQMAQYYQMDYSRLLNTIVSAAKEVDQNISLSPIFIKAILEIDREERKNEERKQKESKPPDIDYWEILRLFLRKGTRRQVVSGEEVDSNELFAVLVRKQPRHMRDFLRKTGREKRMRKSMVERVTIVELGLVARLFAPENHKFIIGYAWQTGEALARHEGDGENEKQRKIVWEVILAYLLYDGGSYFNKREFVKYTIVNIGKERGIEYQTLISMLLCSDYGSHGGLAYQSEWLSILHDLAQEAEAEIPKARNMESLQWKALEIYLEKGQVVPSLDRIYLPNPGELLALFLRKDPEKLKKLLSEHGGHSEKSAENLLKILPFRDLDLLMKVLNPQIAESFFSLLSKVRMWNDRTPMKSLQGIDLNHAFYESAVRIRLKNIGNIPDQEEFASELLTQIAEKHYIGFYQWREEIRAELDKEASATPTTAILAEIMKAHPWSETVISSKIALARDNRFQGWSVKRKLRTLSEHIDNLKVRKSILDLFRHASRHHSRELLDWLKVQARKGKKAISQLLRKAEPAVKKKWLNALIPEGEHLVGKILKNWERAISKNRSLKTSSAALGKRLEELLWQCLLDAEAHQGNKTKFLIHMIQAICLQLNIAVRSLLEALAQERGFLDEREWKGIAEFFAYRLEEKEIPDKKDEDKEPENHYLKHELFPETFLYLLEHGTPPPWLADQWSESPENVIRTLIHMRPRLFAEIAGKAIQNRKAMQRLRMALDYTTLINAAGSARPELQPTLSILLDFYKKVHLFQIQNIDAKTLREILFEKTLKYWVASDWKKLSPGFILEELILDLVRLGRVSYEAVRNEFHEKKHLLPPALQLSLPTEESYSKNKQELPTETEKRTKPSPSPKYFPDETPGRNIFVRNAGLAILQGYIKPYLERLGLHKNGEFISDELQRKAVHYLQYLATGLVNTEEQYLPFNKLLCGLPLSEPVEEGIEIADSEAEVAHSLIKAVIGYWPAIGTTSIEGFQGAWLVREGTLSEKEARWDLVVEKRVYDMLLKKLPFSFSIVNFSWMPKPIYVTWPY